MFFFREKKIYKIPGFSTGIPVDKKLIHEIFLYQCPRFHKRLIKWIGKIKPNYKVKFFSIKDNWNYKIYLNLTFQFNIVWTKFEFLKWNYLLYHFIGENSYVTLFIIFPSSISIQISGQICIFTLFLIDFSNKMV